MYIFDSNKLYLHIWKVLFTPPSTINIVLEYIKMLQCSTNTDFSDILFASTNQTILDASNPYLFNSLNIYKCSHNTLKYIIKYISIFFRCAELIT